MTADKPTKSEMQILERLFVQEVHSSLTARAQLAKKVPPKLAKQMEEKGLIEAVTFVLGRDCLGKIEVPGHVLTTKGHMLYCLKCEDEEGEEDE